MLKSFLSMIFSLLIQSLLLLFLITFSCSSYKIHESNPNPQAWDVLYQPIIEQGLTGYTVVDFVYVVVNFR